MSNRNAVYLTVIGLILSLIPAHAQPGTTNPLRIEISGASLYGDYSIQLFDLSRHAVVSSPYSDGSGFSFHGVPEGQYVARIIDGSGQVVGQDVIAFD